MSRQSATIYDNLWHFLSLPLPPVLDFAGLNSGGPKGGQLKGGHLKMGFRSEVRICKWDFALQFALDTSILTALSKRIPQGRRRLEREGAA